MSCARFCFAWIESRSDEAWVAFLVIAAIVFLGIDRWSAKRARR